MLFIDLIFHRQSLLSTNWSLQYGSCFYLNLHLFQSLSYAKQQKVLLPSLNPWKSLCKLSLQVSKVELRALVSRHQQSRPTVKITLPLFISDRHTKSSLKSQQNIHLILSKFIQMGEITSLLKISLLTPSEIKSTVGDIWYYDMWTRA